MAEWDPLKIFEELRKHSNSLSKGLNEEWRGISSIIIRKDLGEKGEIIELAKDMENLKNHYNRYFTGFFKPMTQNEDQFFRTLLKPNFEGYLNMKTIEEMENVIIKIMHINCKIQEKPDMKSFALTNDTHLSLQNIYQLITILKRLSQNLPSIIRQIDETRDRISNILAGIRKILENQKKTYEKYADFWSEDIRVLDSLITFMPTANTSEYTLEYNLIDIKNKFIMCQDRVTKLETSFIAQENELTGGRGQKGYPFSEIKMGFDEVKLLIKKIVDLNKF